MTDKEINERAQYVEKTLRENDIYCDAESYENGALWARDAQKAEYIEKAHKFLDNLIWWTPFLDKQFRKAIEE